MKKIYLGFLCNLLILFSNSAHADWTHVDSAYQCNQKAQTFILTSVIDSSSPKQKGVLPLQKGFIEINNISQKIKCNFKKNKLELTLKSLPPAPTGTCRGINFITIENLSVNNKKVIEYSKVFNSGCFFEPTLYEITVAIKESNILINKCYGIWSLENGYENSICKKEFAIKN